MESAKRELFLCGVGGGGHGCCSLSPRRQEQQPETGLTRTTFLQDLLSGAHSKYEEKIKERQMGGKKKTNQAGV